MLCCFPLLLVLLPYASLVICASQSSSALLLLCGGGSGHGLKSVLVGTAATYTWDDALAAYALFFVCALFCFNPGYGAGGEGSVVALSVAAGFEGGLAASSLRVLLPKYCWSLEAVILLILLSFFCRFGFGYIDSKAQAVIFVSWSGFLVAPL
ncbi:hypothetical protein U1Q18_012828 [Sarracenia purpurea var. burkii]